MELWNASSVKYNFHSENETCCDFYTCPSQSSYCGKLWIPSVTSSSKLVFPYSNNKLELYPLNICLTIYILLLMLNWISMYTYWIIKITVEDTTQCWNSIVIWRTFGNGGLRYTSCNAKMYGIFSFLGDAKPIQSLFLMFFSSRISIWFLF